MKTLEEIFKKHQAEQNFGTYGMGEFDLEGDLYKKVIELQSQNKELIEAGSKLVNHIIINANTLTSRELLKMCGNFNELKK